MKKIISAVIILIFFLFLILLIDRGTTTYSVYETRTTSEGVKVQILDPVTEKPIKEFTEGNMMTKDGTYISETLE